MNECPEHYGWQQDGTECSTCLKEDEAVIKATIERLGRVLQYKKHEEDCQQRGCRSKSERCCPCTCGRAAIKDIIAMLQKRHQK